VNNEKIRENFPFFIKNSDICYLDSAASSLKLLSVINSLSNYYVNNGTNIDRGVYKLSADATNQFEETRKMVAKFINSNYEEVIFTKGTTDSLNKIMNSYQEFLAEGDEVITSTLEHHSLLLPLQVATNNKKAILKYVELDNDGKITVENFKKVLTNKTKVVALSYVSNVLGTKIPLEEIAKLARSVGAIIIIDAAQAISHLKIDVKKLDIDFLAFSAHKMYGPNGVGILYGKKELLLKIKPFDYGGQMMHLVDYNGATWKEIPHKFEAGTPAIAEVIAYKHAISFLEEIGLKNIYEHEMNLRKYTLEKLLLIDEIIVYNKISHSPIITFNIKNVHPHDAASILDENKIYLRAGNHCAQLVSKHINEESTLRASFGIYNNYKDCDKLILGIRKVIEFFKKFQRR